MEKSERRKKLEQTLKEFNKTQKSDVFSLGSDIEELKVIPSGVKKIDDFLGGGFKCGGHTIIWSPSYSVGKTALALTTIANAQKLGLITCYVNTEKPIEPERFKFFGINFLRLFFVKKLFKNKTGNNAEDYNKSQTKRNFQYFRLRKHAR